MFRLKARVPNQYTSYCLKSWDDILARTCRSSNRPLRGLLSRGRCTVQPVTGLPNRCSR